MEILDSKILLQEEAQQEELEKKAKKKAKTKIQLERTRTAFERLQLAWIRTSLTLITIGVGAYEYFHNRIESGKAPLLKLISGRELGIFLVLIAFIALLLATIQHKSHMSELKQNYEGFRYSVSSLLAYMILFLAIFLIAMMIKL
jgi:uncharacterized membrane protein YidH (DUF202 family)